MEFYERNRPKYRLCLPRIPSVSPQPSLWDANRRSRGCTFLVGKHSWTMWIDNQMAWLGTTSFCKFPESDISLRFRQSPTVAEKTAGAQRMQGYFPIYWDAKQGKLWLEIGTSNCAITSQDTTVKPLGTLGSQDLKTGNF
jgi:hypothetical protein